MASVCPIRGTFSATATAIATRPRPPIPATLMLAALMMSVESGSERVGAASEDVGDP
jgi:hypothetical protein